MIYLNLDYLADRALFSSPYKLKEGVHPFDRQRAIAGLYDYSLLLWQRRGVIWDVAKTALGYVAVLRRSKGLNSSSFNLTWNYGTDPEDAHDWLFRFNRNLNYVVMYDTGLEIPSSVLCVAVVGIARIAEGKGDPISVAEAIQSFDRIGA